MRVLAALEIGWVAALLGCGASDESGVVGTHTTTSDGGGSGGMGGEGGTGAGVSTGGLGGIGGVGGQTSGPCPADMVVAGDSCIDRYEAPNVAGADPLAMQTAHDGETWCAERNKRLCTDIEWIRACEGQSGTTYPYGDSYVAHRCNDDKVWIPPNWAVLGTWPSEAAQQEAAALYQADGSGFRDECLSEDSAYDLTGNVAEWVVRTLPNSNNYDHVMKGCFWAGCFGGTNPNCSFVNPAHPSGFRSYEAGFRCCQDLWVQ
jgi:formylglycine-generating enzyme required for sulfatase activity